MIDPQAVLFLRSPSALWRDLPEEVAVTREGEPDVQILSPTAAAVWRLLDVPRTASDIVTTLSSTHRAPHAQIEHDVEDLLEDLVHRGVVEAVADGDD